MNEKNNNKDQEKRKVILVILLPVILLLAIFLSVILLSWSTASSEEQNYQGLSDEEKAQITAVADYLNETDKIIMLNRQQLDKLSMKDSDMKKSLSGVAKKLLSIQENITNASDEITSYYETYSSDASQTINNSLSEILTEQQEIITQIDNVQKEIEAILNGAGAEAEKKYIDTVNRLLYLDKSLFEVQNSVRKYYSNLAESIEELHTKLEKDNVTLLEVLDQIETELKTTLDKHVTDIGIKIDESVVSLMQELDTLHKQVGEAEKSVTALLAMMSGNAEVRQDEIRAAFSNINKIIMEIAADFKAVHSETKTLIVKFQNSENENHKETLNVLNAMEASMNESSLQNFDKMTESLQLIQDRFDTSMDGIKNEMSQKFDFLNKEFSDGFLSFNGSITQKIDQLDLIMAEKYDVMLNTVITGNKDMQNTISRSDEEMRNHIKDTVDASDLNMQEYIQNILNDMNKKLDQVFQYVSSGKKGLASALTDKGINTDANAKFQVMAANIRRIGEKSNVTSSALLEGFTAYGSNGYVNGGMKNRAAVSASLNCGQSYTIPAGYHNGSGKIIANTLESQTQATATAENLSAGKTGWVNGRLITGTGADVNTAYNKGYADGMQNAINGAGISYTYHKHTGNEQGGGCYTTPVYHIHSSNCNIKVQCACPGYGQGDFLGNHAVDGWPMWSCKNCGHGNWKHGSGRCNDIGEQRNCGKTESSIESYSLGCGKTESTIESATVVFP